MNDWCDSQKKRNSNFRELLQEQIDKANPRRKLTGEETKRLAKLEAIAGKLKRGESRPLRHLKRKKNLLILLFMEQVKLNNNSQSNI